MIVVDTSAIVDALTGVDGSDALRVELGREQMHAPWLLDYEVVSVVRGLTLGGHLSPARAQEVLTDFHDLPIRRWEADAGLSARAFALRTNLSAYDAAFVVLAEALECPLITRDQRLARSGGHHARIRVI